MEPKESHSLYCPAEIRKERNIGQPKKGGARVGKEAGKGAGTNTVKEPAVLFIQLAMYACECGWWYVDDFLDCGGVECMSYLTSVSEI